MAPVSKVSHRMYACIDMGAATNTDAPMIFMVQPIHRLYTVEPNLGIERARYDTINGQGGGGQGLHSNGARVVPHISPRSKRNALRLEQVSQKFFMPIEEASKELGVSKSTLKFRCRELGIPAWPYRKLKSLENLKETVVEFAHPGFQNVVDKLSQEIEAIKNNPSIPIKDETERLRQEFYDSKYKRRRMSEDGF